MYSTTMKKYVSILKQLDNEGIDDDSIDELEEELENLYYDLTEEEIVMIETGDIDEIDTEEEEL